MAAKTDEEKAAEQQEKVDAERAQADAQLTNVADAEAKASADAFEKNQIDEQAKRRKGTDEGSKEFSGQVLANEDFSIVTSDQYGHGRLEVKPTGWVGDGFFVAAQKVDSLKALLGQVKNLPKQEKVSK